MRETPEELERELLSDLETGSETVRIEPTPPAAEGPTWQEGGQPVVTEEPPAERAGAARNVPAALVSGVLLGAAVLALLAINKAAFVVLATAAILLAQAEIYAVMRMRGLQPATLLGLVCGGLTFVGAYLHGEPALLLGPALAMGLAVPWYVAAPANVRKHTTANAAATVLGVAYVPFLASFAMLLLRSPGDVGTYLFLSMLVLTVLYDVSAYAVGTVWGSRPLAPTVSPNKSWEGAIAATFIVLIVALGVVPNFVPFSLEGVGPGPAVGLALVIAIAAPLGDLVESALKRDLGVKDMGSLLPGHGGVLDRIDAVLFAAPASYFFLRIVLG
jgi:phosphatidate cytidylyltransferase